MDKNALQIRLTNGGGADLINNKGEKRGIIKIFLQFMEVESNQE